jgi:hypothetical protein
VLDAMNDARMEEKLRKNQGDRQSYFTDDS